MKSYIFCSVACLVLCGSPETRANEALQEAVPYFGPSLLVAIGKEEGEWRIGQIEVNKLPIGKSFKELEAKVFHDGKTFQVANNNACDPESSISTLTTPESEKHRVNLLSSPFSYPGCRSDVAFKMKDDKIVSSSLILMPSMAFRDGDIKIIFEHLDGMGSVIENLNNIVSSGNAAAICGWIGVAENEYLKSELLATLLKDAGGMKTALGLGICVSEKSKISGKTIVQAIEKLDEGWTPEERKMIVASLYAQHVFGKAPSDNRRPYQALHAFAKIGSKGANDPVWKVVETGFKEDIYPINP